MELGAFSVSLNVKDLNASKSFYESSPDLLILDIAIPEINGWEVCRQIRRTSTVPIVFLTGYHISQEEYRQGLEMGANAYLVKPVSLENILGSIQVALNET